jgi:beta-glucosidase
LSYTTFRYENLKLSRRRMLSTSSVTVTVEVVNTGTRDGDEVVQLYVQDVEASVPVPRHQLQGVKRIHLKAGARKRVSFPLTGSQMACYRDDGGAMVEAGEFRVSVGGGQPDDPASGALSASVTVV